MYDNLIKFCEDNKLMINESFNYNRYGDGNISVTELLSILNDSTFDYIKQNYTEQLENACNRGTLVHSNIELNNFDHKQFHKNSLTINKDNIINKYYLRFKEWKIINGIKILEKEKTFYKDGLRGTIDAITNIGIVDYKSSLRENEKYHLQIAFYCRLSGIKEGYILYLSDTKYKFVKVELEKYSEIISELIELSKNLNKINIQ